MAELLVERKCQPLIFVPVRSLDDGTGYDDQMVILLQIETLRSENHPFKRYHLYTQKQSVTDTSKNVTENNFQRHRPPSKAKTHRGGSEMAELLVERKCQPLIFVLVRSLDDGTDNEDQNILLVASGNVDRSIKPG